MEPVAGWVLQRDPLGEGKARESHGEQAGTEHFSCLGVFTESWDALGQEGP